MGRTLVTGGTGFVGSYVVRALLERGDDVRCTVRRASSLAALDDLEVETVVAELTDRQAVRRAVRGADRVFHVAGLTSMRASAERLQQANVVATRVVLSEALREGVERLVYTSSVTAIGPAPPGELADENTIWRPVGLPYSDSKYAAETEALRLAAQGLPVVIVNPAHVLGWGDHGRSSSDVVRRILLRRIPAYVDGCLNVVDVEDVAAGHVLADERGRVGERYILGNRNYTWERLFSDIGRLSGVEPPVVKVPAAAALAAAQLADRLGLPHPVTSTEIIGASQRWSFRSTKARKELGWTTRPHEETIERTIDWYRERLGDRLEQSSLRQPATLRLAGSTLRRLEGIGHLVA